MLRVVTFKWKAEGYRTKFTAQHVNVLRNMVERHYRKPHEFVCVTDDSDGLDSRIKVVPLWNDYGDMTSPHGPNYPSCYRRLKLFSTEAEDLIGKRFVCLDLDCVIVGDVSPLWDRPEDIVLWGKTNPTTYYNGSMLLMTAGARRRVWDAFDPIKSPAAAKAAGQWGSDQGWISHCLGNGEPIWTTADGVYSYRNHIRPTGGKLMEGARIVHFHGKERPWGDGPQGHGWVRKHWC